MQARKDSREPLNKHPFDLQEAVVLLDVYLDMIKNGTSIMKAAEKHPCACVASQRETDM